MKHARVAWIGMILTSIAVQPLLAADRLGQCVDFTRPVRTFSCDIAPAPSAPSQKQLPGPVRFQFAGAGSIPNQLILPPTTSDGFFEVVLLVDSDNNPATGSQGADSAIIAGAYCNGSCGTLNLLGNFQCSFGSFTGTSFAITGSCEINGINPLTATVSGLTGQSLANTVPGSATSVLSRIVANSQSALLAQVADVTGSVPAAATFTISDAVGDFSEQFNAAGIPAVGRAAVDITSVTVTMNGLSGNQQPAVTLELSNERPAPGAVVTLNWTSTGTGATSCVPSGGAGTGWEQRGNLPLNGAVSESAPPNGTISFTLTCGSASASASLTVQEQTQPPPVPPLAGLVSTSADGSPLDGDSSQPAVSADGGRLAFVSTATNLVAAGLGREAKGAVRRVFVSDLQTGEVVLASVDQAGVALNVDSNNVTVSADAGTVAFDTADGQVLAYLGGLGRTQGISTSAAGAPSNGMSSNPSLTADGRTAVFDSTGDLGVLDPNNTVMDIFSKDLTTGAVSLLTLAADGGPANGASRNPSISSDGAVIAFETLATNLLGPGVAAAGSNAAKGAASQICAGRPEGRNRGCVSSNPVTGQLGDLDSRNVVLSETGRFAAFESDATNLVVGDSNNATDIFWAELNEDLSVASVIRVSTSSDGTQANAASRAPQISADGNQVIFESDATNLDPADGNGSEDVFLKDVRTGQLIRYDRTPSGEEPNGASGSPALSADGTTIAYDSDADNLVDGDVNNATDVYAAPNPVIANPDEPTVLGLVLPPPSPPNASCPAGYFTTTITDGPGTGIQNGSYGLELLLDVPGTRVLSGGLNFGGLVDVGQVGFAGANIANATGENQRLNISLTGNPITDINGNLPVRVTINRRTATTSETVFDNSVTITNAQAFETSIVVSPGYYEALVAPQGFDASQAGGQAEGQFFFSLTTSFVNRPGGGFQGGAVVGGYHAENPFGGVSGFAAFCIATPHTTSIRVLSEPSYGPAGAGDLQLEVLDVNRESVFRLP